MHDGLSLSRSARASTSRVGQFPMLFRQWSFMQCTTFGYELSATFAGPLVGAVSVTDKDLKALLDHRVETVLHLAGSREICRSWNPLTSWLRRLDFLRRAVDASNSLGLSTPE